MKTGTPGEVEVASHTCSESRKSADSELPENAAELRNLVLVGLYFRSAEVLS